MGGLYYYPETCSSRRPSRAILSLGAYSLCLAACAITAPAQVSPLPAGQTEIAQSQIRSGTLWGPAAGAFEPIEASRRDTLLGLAQWDHTLLGAFELSARLLRYSETLVTSTAAPAARPVDVVGRFSTSGGHTTINDIAKAWKVDQLQRQGMNLNMKSPYGNFRLTYREIFSGRANSLGGGIGQASAAAIYTTPRFGAGGLLDFSAAALMGNGSINQLLGGGFGNNNIGGFGPRLRKSEGPTVAIKLTF